jgi:cystathionine beta-lyase/cystathionine gamma-synthase
LTVDYIRGFVGIPWDVSGPNTAHLLLRRLKTLNLRIQQQNIVAQKVAEFLHTQPCVERVITMVLKPIQDIGSPAANKRRWWPAVLHYQRRARLANGMEDFVDLNDDLQRALRVQ